jgi:hypothetical protein
MKPKTIKWFLIAVAFISILLFGYIRTNISLSLLYFLPGYNYEFYLGFHFLYEYFYYMEKPLLLKLKWINSIFFLSMIFITSFIAIWNIYKSREVMKYYSYFYILTIIAAGFFLGLDMIFKNPVIYDQFRMLLALLLSPIPFILTILFAELKSSNKI